MQTTLKIRLTEDQRELIERAATVVTEARGSVNVSAWVRETLLDRARRVIREDREQ